MSRLDSGPDCIILLSYLLFHRTLLGCKDQDQHSSECNRALHGTQVDPFKKRRVVCLAKSPTWHLVHFRKLLSPRFSVQNFWFPFLHKPQPETEEQIKTVVQYHKINRSYRYLNFYSIRCENPTTFISFYPIHQCFWKDNPHLLTSSRSSLQLQGRELCGLRRWVRVRRESMVTVSGAESFSDASACLPPSTVAPPPP